MFSPYQYASLFALMAAFHITVTAAAADMTLLDCRTSVQLADENHDDLLTNAEYMKAIDLYANRVDCGFGGSLLGGLYNTFACTENCNSLVSGTPCCPHMDISDPATSTTITRFCVMLDTVLDLECPRAFPVPAPTNLQDFGSTSMDHMPLQACQGDCSTDNDCAEGLTCYLREGGRLNDPVPGCLGTAPSTSNFCISQSYDPTPTAQVKVHTQDFGEAAPQEYMPLHLCQGSCESDGDCVGDLVCQQRSAGDEIIGCNGRTSTSSNFCVRG